MSYQFNDLVSKLPEYLKFLCNKHLGVSWFCISKTRLGFTKMLNWTLLTYYMPLKKSKNLWFSLFARGIAAKNFANWNILSTISIWEYWQSNYPLTRIYLLSLSDSRWYTLPIFYLHIENKYYSVFLISETFLFKSKWESSTF